MVVKLRQTLEEKQQKLDKMSNQNEEKKKKQKTENEEAVNKAIKMVVVDTSIGLLFKMPLLVMPVVIDLYTYYYYYYSLFDEINSAIVAEIYGDAHINFNHIDFNFFYKS